MVYLPQGYGIRRLSELQIDVSKDWRDYLIKNLGDPVAAGDAVVYPVQRTWLEYPTEDVELTYLASIGKMTFDKHHTWGIACLTVDDFANKAIEGWSCGGVNTLIGRFVDSDDSYFMDMYTGATGADSCRIQKVVAGTSTLLGYETQDLTTAPGYLFKFSISNTTLKGFRDDMTTPKVTVTDTAHATGKWGTRWREQELGQYAPFSLILRAAASPSPKPLAYFEVPVVGDGTLEDPFRAQMPEEIVDDPVFGKTNRLALTHSALIKTDRKTGKPKEYVAIVRILEQVDRQPHLRPITDCIDALNRMMGVKKLKKKAAKKRAKELDDLLTDEDLVEW